MQPVGNGVAPLNSLPGVVLFGVLGRVRLVGIPANGGGINQQVGTHHGRDPGGFGEPLVPANEYAHSGKPGVEYLVTQIAGGEIKFFVVARIVGNVHFPVLSQVRSVGIEHGGGVVVQSLRPFLEQRRHDDHAQFGR